MKYSEGWKSATEQNKKQVQALRSYFRDGQGKPSVFVMRSLLLLNFTQKFNLIKYPGLLTANLKKNDFMTQICSVKQEVFKRGQ